MFIRVYHAEWRQHYVTRAPGSVKRTLTADNVTARKAGVIRGSENVELCFG